MLKMFDIDAFYLRQLDKWALCRENYDSIGGFESKEVQLAGGGTVRVMYNPGRIRSTAARTDSRDISSRPCFLCKDNRPDEQIALDGGDYEILANPYPVFSRHLTIPSRHHVPQSVLGRVGDMLKLAESLPGFTIFYNAPHSGASAPDHMHFQAVPSGELPMWSALEDGKMWVECNVMEGSVEYVLPRVEGLLWSIGEGVEPEINLYAESLGDGRFRVALIPRRKHRPSVYGLGEEDLLISPAALEMAGVIIVPRYGDYLRCDDGRVLQMIMDECGVGVGLCHYGPKVLRVGIVNGPDVEVEFQGGYVNDRKETVPDRKKLSFSGADVRGRQAYTPLGADACFVLSRVKIGIGFHWEQYERQAFHGALELVPDGQGNIQVINSVDVETYLQSVVSSEMSSSAPEEFLKAHAVISRSWVLAQICPPMTLGSEGMVKTDDELKMWYDREAHTGFDVCADDHCQRYQGCTKADKPQVVSALKATRGEVLSWKGRLCDARFSKCCGGVSETFDTCWQDVEVPYLQAVDDPFCGRATEDVLRKVLNGYDRDTTDYYAWEVTYSADELADIIKSRTGVDYGNILEIRPLHRGASGRIDRMEIKGTKRTRIIGKELEIRRTLSRTHLYSSCFDAEALSKDSEGVPQKWIIRGRGWGHGVGLCQIGAAVMASEGYGYKEILKFYFPGVKLMKLYD